MKTFDLLNSICNSHDNMMRDPETADEAREMYDSFLVNRGLSQHSDTVMFANDMNLLPDTPKSAQYEYLQKSVRKRPRYGKWAKSKVDKQLIEAISKTYGVGKKEAIMYEKLLNDGQRGVLMGAQDMGGPQKA